MFPVIGPREAPENALGEVCANGRIVHKATSADRAADGVRQIAVGGLRGNADDVNKIYKEGRSISFIIAALAELGS